MALFFDTAWFDARLEAVGLSRADMAAGASLSAADLTLMFKDQREVSADEVAIFAGLLDVAAAEIADHAGISTPVPAAADRDERIAALEAEIARLRGS